MAGQNELIHLVKHAARQELQDTRTTYWGHLSAYDVTQNSVRVLIPSLRDENGNMYEAGPMSLGTFAAGNGWGFQIYPSAAATPDNLPAGEQVQVVLHERKSGVGAITKMAFNQNMAPPGAGPSDGSSDPNDAAGTNQLQQNEMIVKDVNGTFVKYYKDGHMQIFTKDKLDINTTSDCNVTSLQGNINVTANEGNIAALAIVGDITADATAGDIAVTAHAGNIAISALAQNVVISALQNITISAAEGVYLTGATLIDMASAIINAGTGALQSLCNVTFMELFNAHTHLAPGGETGVPNVLAIPGTDTTVNFEAS